MQGLIAAAQTKFGRTQSVGSVDSTAIIGRHTVAGAMTVWLIKVTEQASLPHARMGV